MPVPSCAGRSAKAVKDELIRRNVAALVDSPKRARTKLDDAMTADEANAVLAAAEGDRLEALAVLALTWVPTRRTVRPAMGEDVNLEAGELTIARNFHGLPRPKPSGRRTGRKARKAS
jgi:hypothetical protein